MRRLGQRGAMVKAIAPDLRASDPRRWRQDDGLPYPWLQKRGAVDGHKFSHGHALVLSGGPGKGGAARLTARAALRVGAGMVTIAPPGDALQDHCVPPDALMRRAIDAGRDMTDALADARITAAALGPGCGVTRAAELVDPLLGSRRPCVLDADALTALASRGFDGLHGECILTPHLGEFARLFPDLSERLTGPTFPKSAKRYAEYPRFIDEYPNFVAEHHRIVAALSDMRAPLYSKLDAAGDAARRCGAVVVLKGPDTVIAAPGGFARIHLAVDVPWLATAGSGDVLTGIIAGLMARGCRALEAASLGVAIHARAALAFGPGLIADDLPEAIPAVLRGEEASRLGGRPMLSGRRAGVAEW